MTVDLHAELLQDLANAQARLAYLRLVAPINKDAARRWRDQVSRQEAGVRYLERLVRLEEEAA